MQEQNRTQFVVKLNVPTKKTEAEKRGTEDVERQRAFVFFFGLISRMEMRNIIYRKSLGKETLEELKQIKQSFMESKYYLYVEMSQNKFKTFHL